MTSCKIKNGKNLKPKNWKNGQNLEKMRKSSQDIKTTAPIEPKRTRIKSRTSDYLKDSANKIAKWKNSLKMQNGQNLHKYKTPHMRKSSHKIKISATNAQVRTRITSKTLPMNEIMQN